MYKQRTILMTRRSEMVAKEIKALVSEIVFHEIKDPRIGFVTFTRVELSADLRQAKIYYSSLGEPEAQDECLEGLRSASGFIRRMVAQRLNLRFAPEIIFKYDEGISGSISFSQKLEEIKKRREADGDEKSNPGN
jgi:ribosome-binding factor A